MCLDELLEVYKLHPQLKALNKCLSRGEKYLQMNGLQGSSMPILFSTLQKHYPDATDKPYVFIMDDEEEAGYLYHDFVQILGDEKVLFFPSSFKRAVKYGQRDAGNEIMRTEVLSRIGGSGQLFIITSPSALSEMVVTSEKLGEQTISLSEGERVDAMFMQETLLSLGFNRVDYVYEPGQFAVRGSILDVYSFSCEFPYRIDFFGDDVDSIRTFDVNTQLSEKRLSQIRIVPQLSKETENRQCFLEFLPPASQLIIKNKEYVCQTVEQIFHEGFLQQALIAGEGQTELEEFQNREKLAKDTLLVRPSTFRVQIDKFCIIELNRDNGDAPKGSKLAFSTHIQPIFHKNFDLIFQSFQDYLAKGYRLYILADSEKQTERLRQIFQDKETGIAFTPVKRTLHAGYVDDDLKACFFTDHQIFDRFHKYNLKSEKAHRGRVALTLKEIQQFELGDYVVHVDHGIGRFGGLIRIPNGDQMQEVIKLIYNHDDIVFVSIHSLHKVSKYKGHEGEQPRISTLGTGAWERMKERTKKKIKDIARDLILLYSKRREEKGFAFSPDSFMQHELEASFIYEDTPDQLKTTQDVKQDMERQRPMDRLVCGDVGFGKTEVAVRAAFKACADNKQVAVLVPTTVLAYQHFRTFSERLRDMPVRIEYLSRARSASKTSKILEELKEGKINIIIGTHKLIGKSVKFHDLGLLIIDEEQKFGVSTKEKLRQMRTNVDTLTLTATPIPRTLQFSLMGARDLSIIQTPPPNRYPIHTQICTFNAETIAEAVNFEMSRNGQVYLVNNRISNLPDLEALVRKYVPDARVVVGHGQMPPEKLEEIILGFSNYDYDVLISTTIIESGIDIPNANTIIINGAHNFGLSDLHQMRGRVGRSNKKAFCYLLAPPLAALSTDARRRLQAIENYSDLGSGIHIAMQDLDIRGAGNLLGAEQSGFIADLGYETYQKILSQAVKELRNEEFQELFAEDVQKGIITEGHDFVDECQLESDLQMYFSEEYVPTASERMLLYRELDGLESPTDVDAFCQRMNDRFGPIPHEGEELIQVVHLRRLGRYFGTERIILKNGRMRLYFVNNQDSPFYQSAAFGQILQFATTNIHRCKLDVVGGRNTLLLTSIPSVKAGVDILQQISEISGEL